MSGQAAHEAWRIAANIAKLPGLLQKPRASITPMTSTPDISLHCANAEAASPYSISSSARASSEGGTVRPSALAVSRLMTSSNLVGR
jgi:hypothetical protein